MALLDVKNVKKIYTTRFGGNQVEALRDVTFSVEPREYVAIMGESGSGKTTLLNILAALDRPTGGKVYLKGRDLSGVKELSLIHIFPFDKFISAKRTLTTQMKATGEVMSICDNFEGALMKAIRCLLYTSRCV